MKKYIALLLVISIVLTLSVSAFADNEQLDSETLTLDEAQEATVDRSEEREVHINDSEDPDKPILHTDVSSSTYDMTHFDDRKELEEVRMLETEDAYTDLYDRIGDNNTYSVYWFESDTLPVDVTITVENVEEYKGFSYLYWKDDKIDGDWDSELNESDKKQHLIDNWYELKHEFDKVELTRDDLAFDLSKKSVDGKQSEIKKHTVTLTIENNGPIAIVTAYGSFLAGLAKEIKGAKTEWFTSSVYMVPVILRGNQTAELPSIIASDENITIIPYKDVKPDLDLITEEQWEQFKRGCKELKEHVPDGMATRYLFYLIENEPSDIVIRMDDIGIDDKVETKMYDGFWNNLYCKVISPGRVTIHANNTGLYAIFTEIKTDIFE